MYRRRVLNLSSQSKELVYLLKFKFIICSPDLWCANCSPGQKLMQRPIYLSVFATCDLA